VVAVNACVVGLYAGITPMCLIQAAELWFVMVVVCTSRIFITLCHGILAKGRVIAHMLWHSC
jgi:hypothetical protein